MESLQSITVPQCEGSAFMPPVHIGYCKHTVQDEEDKSDAIYDEPSTSAL
jgi:hypothetical protein